MATKNDTLHHPDHYTLVGGGDHRRLGVLDLLHGLREGGNMPRAICRFNTSYVLLLGPWSAPVKGLGSGYSLADAPNHSGQHAVVGGGDHQLLDAPQLPSLRGGGGRTSEVWAKFTKCLSGQRPTSRGTPSTSPPPPA